MRSLFLLLFLAVHIILTAQVATIPFEEDGLVYINVTMSKSETPLSFIFDTGASSSVIDTRVAKRIGLISNHSTMATGASGSQAYKLATGQTLTIEGIDFSDVNLVFVDLEALSKRSGRPIEGIIGYDLLKRFTTLMDFNTQQIQLYNDINDIDDRKEYKAYPMTMDFSIPLVELQYTLADGTSLKGDFLFDSGAHLTLLFNSPYAKKHTMKTKIGHTIAIESRGLTTSFDNISGTLPSLSMSGYTFTDVPVSLSQATSGVSAFTQIAGILGADLIDRFNIIIDYANNALYMRPNATFAKAFEYPIKGFVLENDQGKIMISQVFTSMEAYAEGMREGDQLMRIDGISYPSLKEFRKALKSENKTVLLEVLTQEGVTKEYTITLKRIT